MSCCARGLHPSIIALSFLQDCYFIASSSFLRPSFILPSSLLHLSFISFNILSARCFRAASLSSFFFIFYCSFSFLISTKRFYRFSVYMDHKETDEAEWLLSTFILNSWHMCNWSCSLTRVSYVLSKHLIPHVIQTRIRITNMIKHDLHVWNADPGGLDSLLTVPDCTGLYRTVLDCTGLWLGIIPAEFKHTKLRHGDIIIYAAVMNTVRFTQIS